MSEGSQLALVLTAALKLALGAIRSRQELSAAIIMLSVLLFRVSTLPLGHG